MDRERVTKMTYANQATLHANFEMQPRHQLFVMANFANLKERWKARREQKRRARYASCELSDDVLRDIGINRAQIVAAELALSR